MSRKKENPYQKCPVYETKQFILRIVAENDAEDLLQCYSDPVPAKFFNSDNCTSNFVYKTLDEMKDCIKFWIEEYKKQYYIRFSVVDKLNNKAIGTIEIFEKPGDFCDFGKVGILRIDLASRYEKTEVITELLNAVEEKFYDDFEIDSIITKAIPEAKQRIAALENKGFKDLESDTVMPFDFYFIKSKRK